MSFAVKLLLFFVGMIMVLFTLHGALALTVNSWNDGYTSGNMTFTSKGNTTKLLSLPVKSIVDRATISLKPYNYTSYSYQETANSSRWSSTTNVYNPTYAYDGDWTTTASTTSNRNFYVNYTQKAYSYRVVWKTKDLRQTHSFTLINDCFSSVLQLRVFLDGSDNISYYCRNGSNWYNLYTEDVQYSLVGRYLYEEGINWSVRHSVSNLSFDTGNNSRIDYTNNSLVSGIVINTDLNKTAIQNVLISGETEIPIKFVLGTAGYLEYSNLFINYTTNYSANLKSVNTSSWIQTLYHDETATQTYYVNNSGDWNATNCSCASSGGLNNFLSCSPYNAKINNLSKVVVTISNPSAVTYGVETLDFFCYDGDDQLQTVHSSNDPQILLTVNQRPVSTGGGGSSGGGAVIAVAHINGSTILDFGTKVLDFLVVNSDSTAEKVLAVKNRGSVPLEGAILSVDGPINKWVIARLCSLDMKSCSTTNVNLKAGETKYLVVSAVFDDSIGSGAEGIIKFVGQDKKVYELPTTVSRVPAYTLIQKISGFTGLGETASFVLFVFGTITVLFFVSSMVIRW